MPSRKQRRRRQKQQRHEWEEVYVDEEGREVPVEEAAELEQSRSRDGRRESRGARTKGASAARATRTVEPPSWRRTLKRGLLFFPLMLITIFLLAGDDVTAFQKVVQSLVLMAFFLPFSYFMDSVMWRSYQRRLAKGGPKKS